MTTEPTPSPRHHAAAPRAIIVRTAVIALLAALLLAVVALVVSDVPGGLGALVGGLLAVLVFGSGALAVEAMARRSAVEALLTAMTTYLGQAIALVVILVALSRSGLVDDELSRGWLAGGVVATALTWSLVQIVMSQKARIPTYDLPAQGGS